MGVVRSVARTLAGMGFATKMRAITEDGHFSLHLMLEEKSDGGLPVRAVSLCFGRAHVLAGVAAL